MAIPNQFYNQTKQNYPFVATNIQIYFKKNYQLTIFLSTDCFKNRKFRNTHILYKTK